MKKIAAKMVARLGEKAAANNKVSELLCDVDMLCMDCQKRALAGA